MCLYVRKSIPKRMIATEAVVCYKRIGRADQQLDDYEDRGFRANDLVSIFQYMRYKVRTTYTSKLVFSKELKPDETIIGRVHKGLHSYTTLETAKKQLHKLSGEVLIECRIPKGAEYYYDPMREEYASDTLRTIKLIK